jgi:branched-chain amino acid transport system ATP-binding protein
MMWSGLVVAALFLLTIAGTFNAGTQPKVAYQRLRLPDPEPVDGEPQSPGVLRRSVSWILSTKGVWVFLQCGWYLVATANLLWSRDNMRLWIGGPIVLCTFATVVYLAVIRPKLSKESTKAIEAQLKAAEDVTPGNLLVEAKSLVAGYVPEVNILNGCDIQLAAGELVGIIGPNGAGKSTLLKAVFGLIPVREGSVTLRGEDITGLTANELVERGIGYVPQTNNVFPSLSIEENLEMGLYLRPSQFERRLAAVTDLFPLLGERRKQRAGSLSGGERQMLAMGRALMMEPSVLLLDEPSAGLSPVFQDEVFIRCAQINRAGVSILMVEQNARRCLEICHRGYVLDQGTNAYTDTGKDLLEDPKVIELYLGTLAKAK